MILTIATPAIIHCGHYISSQNCARCKESARHHDDPHGPSWNTSRSSRRFAFPCGVRIAETGIRGPWYAMTVTRMRA